MKWKIEYGMCDGVGPFTEEIEADELPEFFATLKRAGAINNINYCVPCGATEVRPGATFDEWWEANGEPGKFKFISQNIIKWIEETR